MAALVHREKFVAIIAKDQFERPRIDLAGPQGNAFSLLGVVSQLGGQLGWDKAKIQALQDEMKSSDYDHLVRVFDKNFGELVDLVVPPGSNLLQDIQEASPKRPRSSP